MRIGSFSIGLEHVSLEDRETRGLNEVDINNKSNKIIRVINSVLLIEKMTFICVLTSLLQFL
jgi:hypothetical protein